MTPPRDPEGRVRVFENPLLESLTRVHPVFPVCFWGPAAFLLLALGGHGGLGPETIAGLAAAGLLAWTLAEYLLHRFVFHWEPPGERLRRWYYPVHRLHHDVQERDRLLAPPLMALPLWLAFLGLFSLILGAPASFPFLGGFTLGYLAYDYIHYATHFARPRSLIGRGLRRRHLQHHFAREDRWYGISSPFWDYVLRTHLRPGEKAKVRPAAGATGAS
jgi:sterol desaturase/sphingolipid hydroxylase (fatty acid hydroxylase superfamily)